MWKTLCNFEPHIWPESITSRDAESVCFKGSRTSCTVIIFGFFWASFGRKRFTSRDGCILPYENKQYPWAGSGATLFRTPPGPAIQLATKPAFHLVIKSSLNPIEIPLNLTDNPPNLTGRARNQTERIAVSNAALIAKLMASKLLGSKEKDLLKLLNPPNNTPLFRIQSF